MKKYIFYILLGLLYSSSKLIFTVYGFLGLRALIYGIITSGLTTCVGILAFIEFRKKGKRINKPIGHWLAVLLPLLIIPFTPLVMIYEKGSLWIQEIDRLIVFIIFEITAIAQFIIAINMYKFTKS